MKLTMQQIADAMPALAKFAQKEMPARAAYRVSKIVRKMNAEFQDFDKARVALARRLGEEVEPGTFSVPVGEKREEFARQVEELLKEEVELEGCALVPWADIEKMELAPILLADLAPIIEDPKD